MNITDAKIPLLPDSTLTQGIPYRVKGWISEQCAKPQCC